MASNWWHLPDSVVRGATDHEAVPVLQAGNATLVPIQGPHELTRAGAPHLGTHGTNSLRAAPNKASALHKKPLGIHRQRGLKLTEE